MRNRVIATAVFVLALAACGGDDGDATVFDETPTAISITATTGNVTIDGGADVAGAEVVADTGEPDRVEISMQEGTLSIADDCADECRVDYTVAVGAGADVTISTTEGPVQLNEVTGNVQITSDSGDVSLLTVTGDLGVTTGEGDILGTRLTADTAEFEAGTGNIDVTFDEPLTSLRAVTGAGNITAQLDASTAYAVTAESPADPDIQVDVDETAAATVELATDDGSITVYRR